MTITPWDSVATDTHPAPIQRPVEAVTDSWVPVLASVAELAGHISQTEFVPTALRGSVPKTAAAILYARELGLPPMTGLASVHVINGKAGLYAETQRALILSAGHDFRVASMDESRCVVKCRRRGEDEWSSFSYTMAEAERSGDSKKNPNYKSRPAEMLLARATGRAAKALFPDVIKGLGAVEEITTEDGDTESVAAVPRVEAVPQQPAQVGRKPRAKKTPPAPPAPAPERRRVPLPKPTGQSSIDPATGEVVDAPTGQDALPQEALPERDSHRKAVIAAVMHWDRLGVTDREERIWYTRQITGKPDIASTNDLTAAEVRQLVQALEAAPDLAAIDAQYVDAQEAGDEQ